MDVTILSRVCAIATICTLGVQPAAVQSFPKARSELSDLVKGFVQGSLKDLADKMRPLESDTVAITGIVDFDAEELERLMKVLSTATKSPASGVDIVMSQDKVNINTAEVQFGEFPRATILACTFFLQTSRKMYEDMDWQELYPAFTTIAAGGTEWLGALNNLQIAKLAVWSVMR